MDQEKALDELRAAAAEYKAAKASVESTREHLREVVRKVVPPLKQADVVRETGWTRETVRLVIDPEKTPPSRRPKTRSEGGRPT